MAITKRKPAIKRAAKPAATPQAVAAGNPHEHPADGATVGPSLGDPSNDGGVGDDVRPQTGEKPPQDAPTTRRGLRICVYAIAKDEAKFARRWIDSMREADDIVVLDTGSTDGTPEILRRLGAAVAVAEFGADRHFRFDDARNASMAMIPAGTDICVCTDLDEEFRPGWRRTLEDAWNNAIAHGINPTTARYLYNHSFDPKDGSVRCSFMLDKIHAPRVCRWDHPVHEVLAYDRERVCIDADIVLDHHPDTAKSRSGYLDLLKTAVRERPDDARDALYHGRELWYRHHWREAIQEMRRYLGLPGATRRIERAFALRVIACCYGDGLKDEANRVKHLRLAVSEDPTHREAAVDIMRHAYPRHDWETCLEAGRAATAVAERTVDYLVDPRAWTSWPWDVLSIAAWNLGLKDEARNAVRRAVELSPADDRIAGNARLMGVFTP